MFSSSLGRVAAMRGWVVVLSCVSAILFAVVVLSFLAYEISWKARRLRAERIRLAHVLDQLGQLARSSRRG